MIRVLIRIAVFSTGEHYDTVMDRGIRIHVLNVLEWNSPMINWYNHSLIELEQLNRQNEIVFHPLDGSPLQAMRELNPAHIISSAWSDFARSKTLHCALISRYRSKNW